MAPSRTSPRSGGQLADQQPQKGRFACSVGTDEAYPIAAHHAHRHVGHDRLGTVGLGHSARFEHELARLVRLLCAHAHGADLIPPRRALLAHGHQRADAPFVSGTTRLDALPQPDLFLSQPLVELLLLHGLVGKPLLLAARKRRIVAGPGRELSAIELDDPRGQALQEGAVVRDEHHRTGILGEKAFEPRDGLDVQVVGGLVEQQHVRLRHERAREEHAPPPSAGQRID